MVGGWVLVTYYVGAERVLVEPILSGYVRWIIVMTK